MGLFSKKVECHICQRNCAKGEYYTCAEGEIKKHYCNICLMERNIYGYSLYCERYLKGNVTLNCNAFFQYRKYFNIFFNDKNNRANCESSDMYDKTSIKLSGTYINNKFIILPFEKVVIPTDDVFAIGMQNCISLSNTKADTVMISFFTSNRLVPYFATVVTGKPNFFSLTGKAKGMREGIEKLLTTTCKNLKYEIQKPGKFKKIVEADGWQDSPIPKNELLMVLYNADLQRKQFDPKIIAEDQIKGFIDNSQLNTSMGFISKELI